MPGFHAEMEQGLNCYKVFRGLEPPGRGGLGPDLLMVCAHAWSLTGMFGHECALQCAHQLAACT